MGKLRSTLTCIWFYIAMALACFLPYRELYQAGMPIGQVNQPLFYVIAGLCIFTFIVYFICEHKANKMKIDWVLAAIFLILIATNIFAIWTNKDHYIYFEGASNIVKDVYIGTEGKIRYTITLIVMFLLAYATSFVLGRHKVRSGKLVWFAIGVTLAGVGICGYSAFADVIPSIKSGVAPWNAPQGATAFFGNENMFGMFLFFCIIASLIVIRSRPKLWWFWIFTIIFLGFIFCATSTTAVSLSILLIASFVVFQVICCFAKKKLVRATLGTSLILIATFSIIIVAAIGYANNVHIIVSAVEFVKNAIFDKDFLTISGRTELWQLARCFVREEPGRLIYGYGYGISNDLFDFYTRLTPVRNDPHSAFLQVLISFGWIGLGLYILLMGYFIYCVIRLICKKRFTFAFSYLLFAGFVTAYVCLESYPIFDLSAFGIFATLMVYLPPIIAWKQMRHPKFQQDIKTAYVIPTQGVPSKNFTAVVAMFITSLTITLGLSLICKTNFFNEYRTYIVPAVIALTVSMFFVPYLTFQWYKKATNRRFILRIILNSMLILGVSGGAFIVLNKLLNNSISIYIAIAIYAIMLVLETLFYSLARKGNIKQWFKCTINGVFVAGLIPLLVTATIEIITFIVLPNFVSVDLFMLIFLLIGGLIIYWTLYLIIPWKQKKEIINDFNEEGILTLKRLLLEDEK